MEDSLILCGGTGAHTAVAFLRLHTLGHALGFFDREDRRLELPTIYLVDQDSGDNQEGPPTAWQLARRLTNSHPARHDWTVATGVSAPPELVTVTPLPVGANKSWSNEPNTKLQRRFESSELLHPLTSDRQRSIDFSKGMMGSPAVGSLLFKLKKYDQRGEGLNHDEIFGQLLQERGRIVVAGSGVGGTGASVGPTLAQDLAEKVPGQVMAVVILDWFEFEEDEVGDDTLRERAQRRNRLMRENAQSALAFFGEDLARHVAAVPVGMPSRSLVRRRFTGDVGQPVRESFVHAVAALSTFRHYLHDEPYQPGLYMMGAVDPGRLDPSTAIPGGTLQSLADQGATLAHLLDTWAAVLGRNHADSRVQPILYDIVAKATGRPDQVADALRAEAAHYGEQLRWMGETLGVKGEPRGGFTREEACRERLSVAEHRLELRGGDSAEEAAGALFHWTARWIRDEASSDNELVTAPGKVGGSQWPELTNEDGLGVAAESNGELSRIPDSNRQHVLKAFVDSTKVSANGWPHPLAAADYFGRAVEQQEPVAMRQLGLLLVGCAAGILELRPIHVPTGAAVADVSLEKLVLEARRKGLEGLAEWAVTYPARDHRIIGFTSPETLLCPVPSVDEREASYQVWDELWRTLTEDTSDEPWHRAEEPSSWGQEHDLVIQQIRSWVVHQKRARPGSSPPWTRVFEHRPLKDSGAPYGLGARVKVLWGTPSDPQRELVELHLPSREIGDWDPRGFSTLTEDELRKRVESLDRVLDDEGEALYEMVEIELPDREERIRGYWEEHLEALRRMGQIHIWARDKEGSVVVGVMVDGELHACLLDNSRLLSSSAVSVGSCTPMAQEPVPGSRTEEGSVRYPHLPLKGEYLDLVETPDGHPLLDGLKEGARIDLSAYHPRVGREGEATRLEWKVPVRGRKSPLPVVLRLEAESKPHKAHWMVWPRFRSRDGSGWKAYYVYEHCTHRLLFLDTLWLKAAEGEGRLKRRKAESAERDLRAYPVAYRTESTPAHKGGPPLALSVRNVQHDREHGLYLVPLEVLGEVGTTEVSVGVDFGTSHSAAAVEVEGDSEVKLVELDQAEGDQNLSLHVSEDNSQVEEAEKKLGIRATGSWLPTYFTDGDRKGFLPSELALSRTLDEVKADDIAKWVPVKDYTIPPMDIGREKLSQYVLTDFKWSAGDSYFRGRERELQEHYLSLFLELVLADVVAHHLRGFPVRQTSVTLTYPLRSRQRQVEELESTLERTLERCSASLGLDLGLHKNVGLYDESRAAQVSSERRGEVVMVADLGGGTLDLFISASGTGEDSMALPEVADSVKIGGNLLLRQIAESADRLLPAGDSWNSDDTRDTETKLRAWMRSMGCSRLFGLDAGDSPHMPQMGLAGFKSAADAGPARTVIDRYFRLIGEYLARNLVAYLVRHWYPRISEKDHSRLKLSLQLRGNGWQLRYQDEEHVETTDEMCHLVQGKVEQLWEEIDWERLEGGPFPVPAAEQWVEARKHVAGDPKTTPVRGVVGKSMPFKEVQGKWLTHTMVELELHQGTGESRVVDWLEPVPFHTGNSKNVEVGQLSPPLVVSSPNDHRTVAIDSLDNGPLGEVNRKLKGEEGVIDDNKGTYRAPVGALVWEAVFEGRDFWSDS